MATILNVRESESSVIAMPMVARFDLLETDQFRDEMSVLTAADETRPLLIDLSQVQFVTSATLGALAEIGQHCRDAARPLALIRLQPKVLDVIRTCSMDQVLSIHETEDHALAAL